MNLLFWNLKNNANEKIISNCLDEKDIDIALFAEYKNTDFKYLCGKLAPNYQWIDGLGGCDKITLISKTPIDVTIKQEQDRYTLYEIGNREVKYIICGIHLQDRMNSVEAIRISTIGRLLNDIRNLESRIKCQNTIIIGDFNANPFDPELLQMNAFHAVLFKDIINKSETRTVAGQTYRRFYNPIIHYLSEDTKMYGSYYHASGSATPIWHCLDQILVSKTLADSITNVEYLKRINKTNLLKSIKPDSTISDHLPLISFIKEVKND